MRRNTRRSFLKGTAAVGAAGVLAGCTGDEIDENEQAGNGGNGGNGNGGNGGDGGNGGNGDGGDYPSQPITTINAYSEGGGIDTNLRQVQPYFEEHLGENLRIEYQAGAGTRTAVTSVTRAEDLYTIGVTMSPATPSALAFDEAEGSETEFSLEDIKPIGSLSSEAAIFRVREDDDRFETMEDVIAEAESNPGELTVGCSGPTNRNMLATIMTMEATGVDFNLIPFDGGGATQTALLQGEIDIANRSVFNSLSIAEDSRALAIFAEENKWSDLTDDCPPINEALGTDINYGPTDGTQIYYTSAQAAEAHSDDYEYAVDAFKSTHEDEEYRNELAENDEEDKLNYLTPDECEELMQSAKDSYAEFIPLFEEHVQQ